MFETIDIGRDRVGTETGSVATGEQETAAALLDEAARQPAEQEELARVRVADLGIAKENATVFQHYRQTGGTFSRQMHTEMSIQSVQKVK